MMMMMIMMIGMMTMMTHNHHSDVCRRLLCLCLETARGDGRHHAGDDNDDNDDDADDENDDLKSLQSCTPIFSFSFHLLRLDWQRVQTRMQAEPTSPVLMALTMRSSGTITFLYILSEDDEVGNYCMLSHW